MSDTAGPASHYDEFGLFHENIAEFGLDVAIPTVVRGDVELDAGRSISALTWGEPGAAEVVFVHGGAQNAHTWDTVALALGRPALAVDLPGHGHSSWRSDGAYSPANLADDVAAAIRQHAPEARLVVGMSLGGLTSMLLATRHPDLVQSLVMVDITPGSTRKRPKRLSISSTARSRSRASTTFWPGQSSSIQLGLSRHCDAASCTTLTRSPTDRGSGTTTGPIASTVTKVNCRACRKQM